MYLDEKYEIGIKDITRTFGYSETFFYNLPNDIQMVLIEKYFNIPSKIKIQKNKKTSLTSLSEKLINNLDLIIDDEKAKKEKIKSLIRR